MANMIVVPPLPVAAIAASRGTGVANLLTADPKEVWVDSAVATPATIDIDLGAAQSIDTVFLGHVYNVGTAATWAISGGLSGYSDVEIKASGTLRVPDADDQYPPMSHALWFGDAVSVRYLRITVTKPVLPVFMIGVVLIGRAFQPELNKEFGAGRRVIDTGVATPLPSGGYGIAEGVRKRGYNWTFADLTLAEIDALEAVALDRGETATLLAVEDPAPTTSLRNRIHYGLFTRFRQFERRNAVQTRWELGIEEWV